MDTSPEYIKKCDCPEIQGLRERAHGAKCNAGKIGHGLNGDVFYFPAFTGGDFYKDYLGDSKYYSIWLPQENDS